MKRIYQVGGVVYKLLQTPQKQTVQDLIEIPSVSMSHYPISVDDLQIQGYTPQYTFGSNDNITETSESLITPIITMEEHKMSKPDITSIILSDATSQLTPDSESVSVKPDNHSLLNPGSVTNVGKSYDLSWYHPENNTEKVWYDTWNEFGTQLGLKDEKAYLYLLGQIKHESNNFENMSELADGSAYEGRSDLGNTRRGDGRKYKGRGPIQVTGRANYEKIYKEFFVPNGLGEYDIVNNPELANDPRIGSLLSIGWLATTNNGRKAIKESNNYNIAALTKAINGGNKGLEDRIRRTTDLLNTYNYN